MILIRSLLFNITFPLWTIAVSILCSPVLLTGDYKKIAFVGRLWANGTLFMLRILCGISYEIRGRENIPDIPFIIASKHQSAWDTVIFLKLHNNPAYILKKELLKIPFFGIYLKGLKMIPIDREGGSKALKQMLNDVKERLSNNRTIVIFPEGTRTAPGDKTSYQPGVAFIYKDIENPIVPVALNSGLYWGKSSFIKKPGKIILEYLPPIKEGLDRKSFTKTLENAIEEPSKKLQNG